MSLLHAINAELAKRLTLHKDDDGEPRLVFLAGQLEPEMRRRFLAAIQRVNGDVDLGALVDAVRSGQASAIETALKLEQIAATLDAGLTPSLREGFNVGATVAHQGLEAAGLTLRFDLVNPHAVTWVQTHGAELVTGLSDESRAAVRTTIETAFTEGRDVRRTARALREVLGLTERQAEAVEHFRQRLSAAGADAETADRRTARYATAQLRDRALTVARTEIMRASNEGQQSLWEIARREGLLRDDETRRVWIATPGTLHVTCAELDEKTAPLTGPFPGGYMGPPLHPNCRCTTGLVTS